LNIPGLPSLPTDNFHKFEALAGIWLIAGSIAISVFMLLKLDREYFELELLVETKSAELKELSDRTIETAERVIAQRGRSKEHQAAIKEADAKLKRLTQSLNAQDITRAQLDEIERVIANTEADIGHLQQSITMQSDDLETTSKAIDAHKISTAAMTRETAKLVVLSSRFAALVRNAVIVVAAGLALGLWGVWLAKAGLSRWRYIQEVQDDHLLRQLARPASASSEDPLESSPR